MPAGLARAALAETMATYWKMPERRAIATISIMPVSSARVLKSMPSTACSWFRMPSEIMRPAPTSATMARLSFSVMMVA